MRSPAAGFALFLIRRLLGIAVPAWAVTLAAFGLFRIGVPSQIADAQINAQLGPGEPASWQYAHYLLRLLHDNLGQSLTVGLPVSHRLGGGRGNTHLPARPAPARRVLLH